MSRIEDNSVAFRKKTIAKNIYNNNNTYNVSNPNALSDGDNKGKGENNNQVGSADDIKKRDTLLVKNKFTKNKEYNDATA